MKTKLMFILLVALSFLQFASAQKSFYYNGESKVPVETLQDKFVVITFDDKQDDLLKTGLLPSFKLESVKGVRYRISLFGSINSEDRVKLLPLLDRLKEKGLIVLPCYKDASGLELSSTIDINVKIKKAEDKAILEDYARKNNLEIVKQNGFMPLWYILSIKSIKNGNVLEQANKIKETALFASAFPVFTANVKKEEASISLLFDPSYAIKGDYKLRPQLHFSLKADGDVRIESQGLLQLDKEDNGKMTTYKLIYNEETIQKAFDVKIYAKVKEFVIFDEVLVGLTLANCPDLERLDISSLPLSSLDCSANRKLKALVCRKLPLVELKLPKSSSLNYLECRDCSLKELPLEDFKNLKILKCSMNKLSALNLANNKNLEVLELNSNEFSSIDLSPIKNLKLLNLSNNPISNFDFSGLKSLESLFCSGTLMERMDISPLSKLERVVAEHNKFLKRIVFSQDGKKTENLQRARLSDNALEELDLSELDKLYAINCEQNQLKKGACRRLVESLQNHTYPSPVINSKIRIIDTKSSKEGNLCYEDDVIIAQKKGWECYDYNGGVKETKFRGLVRTALDETFMKNKLNALVSPNPVSDRIVIEGALPNSRVILINLNGEMVFEGYCSEKGDLYFSTQMYGNGLYLLKIGRQVHKILIQK